MATRPTTLIAGVSPVLLGSAMAGGVRSLNPALFFCTLLFSLLIQIGTNFSNDYFDFLKGADTSERKGPKRAVEQGWISPPAMLFGAFLTFAFAFLIAIPLMLCAGWWSFPLAALAILLGILYTGGPRPLGYLGLGEFLVFLFFGPVAMCGTYFLQTSALSSSVFLASLAPGLLSCSLLIANNLRDEKTDRAANKKTLIVRFGRKFGSWEYSLALIGAGMIPLLLVLLYRAPLSLLSASLILPLSLPCLSRVFSFQHPLELIPVLERSSLLLLAYTILFSVAVLFFPATS